MEYGEILRKLLSPSKNAEPEFQSSDVGIFEVLMNKITSTVLHNRGKFCQRKALAQRGTMEKASFWTFLFESCPQEEAKQIILNIAVPLRMVK